MKPKIFIFVKSAIFAIGFLIGWGAIALLLRKLDIYTGFKIPEYLFPLGIIMMIAGITIAFSSVYLFAARGNGTPAPFDPPKIFVAVGPYKYIRNPMYVGGLTLLIGFAFYLHSSAILLLVPVLALAFQLFVIYYEEPDLERRFGESYLQYKKEVNRWLPVINKK